MRRIRWFLSILLAISVVVGTAFCAVAADASVSLSDHDETVCVTMYESVKILTGFVPGECFSDAAAKFACGERMVFTAPDGSAVADLSMPLFSGAIVYVTESDKILDLGIFAVFGDVDGNGKCTSADARLILRHAASLESLSVVAAAAGDCSGDGKINSADARIALRVASGIAVMENPIVTVPGDAEPIAIYAYYTGSDPEAGTKLNVELIRVVVVYNDAKSTILDSGFTVDPESLTSDKPGKATFTVKWQGFSSSMAVNFTERTPVGLYPDGKVPDYAAFTGIAATEVLHNIDYITYVYPAKRNMTDFVCFESYMSYLTACGFTLADKRADAGQIAALFVKNGENCKAALIYDFTNQKIYIAVQAD